MKRKFFNKKKQKAEGSVHEVIHALMKNRRAKVGLFFILILILVAIFADRIAPFTMTQQDLANALAPAGSPHFLGTDELGRDVFSRILFGARVSLIIGISSVLISLLIGGTFGLIAGYYGGKIDGFIMRLTDVLLSIPSILLAIAIVASFGSSLRNLIFAIGFGMIPMYVRVARSSTLSVREKQFIEAANAMGVNDFNIMMRYILPNILSPLIVQATMGVASAITSAAGLGFIGLGMDASVAEWGTMLNYGRAYIRTHSNLTLYPGLAVMLTILSFNLLGDGLRDAIDPKMRD